MSDRKQDRITDQDKLKHYRTEIPNIIDDFGLSVYAHRLYSHYKRACGTGGSCDQGVRYIADLCKMSVGMVTQAKKELAENGLIWIEPVKTKGGIVDSVTLPDLWEFNFPIYAAPSGEKRDEAIANMKRSLSEHPMKCSSCEHLRSRSEHLRSSRELKKEHLKKEHSEKEHKSLPANAGTAQPTPPFVHEVKAVEPHNVPNLVENAPAKEQPPTLVKVLETPPPVPASPSPVDKRTMHQRGVDAYYDNLPPGVRPKIRSYGGQVGDGIKQLIKHDYSPEQIGIATAEAYKDGWWIEKAKTPIPVQTLGQSMEILLRKAKFNEPRTSDNLNSSGGNSAAGEAGEGAVSDRTRELSDWLNNVVNDPERVARMSALQRNGILPGRKAG